MKRLIKLSSILIIVLVLLVTGCEKQEESTKTKGSQVKKTSDLVDNVGTLRCARQGTVENGSGEFNYIVNYQDGEVVEVYSIESVTSDNQDTLKQYEDAYNKIDSYYEDIDNYVTEVRVESNKVTHIIDINYKKIDIKKLIELEGEEDNIFENNKPMLNKWLDLSKKLGVSCYEL